MKGLIIIGAGGQGRETAQLVKDINRQMPTWDLLGYIDDRAGLHGEKLNGFPVLGSTNLLKSRIDEDVKVVCAIGVSKMRRKVIASIEKAIHEVNYATLIHPSAIIGDETDIGPGTVICANSVVTTNVKIGKHVLVNYGSTIGHDTLIDDFATILPGTNVSGNVRIHKCADIGSGSTIIPNRNIGQNSIVGAGAVVTKDLPADCTAVGVPAKPIKFHK